jgi:hypothetical protein
VVHAVLTLEISMTTSVSISLTAVDEPVGQSLPAGVCHVSEVMPTVLARYGLSLEERPDSERPAVATGANDFFDVSITALESVLAS